MATETKTKTLRVSFDDETFAAINDLIEGTHVTISEMVHTLVCIGLDELSNSFPGEVARADNDRLRILISDIQGFSLTPPGSLSIEDLDRLDQNISERIAAEIDHQEA